jgi:hypothetical protein
MNSTQVGLILVKFEEYMEGSTYGILITTKSGRMIAGDVRGVGGAIAPFDVLSITPYQSVDPMIPTTQGSYPVAMVDCDSIECITLIDQLEVWKNKEPST